MGRTSQTSDVRRKATGLAGKRKAPTALAARASQGGKAPVSSASVQAELARRAQKTKTATALAEVSSDDDDNDDQTTQVTAAADGSVNGTAAAAAAQGAPVGAKRRKTRQPTKKKTTTVTKPAALDAALATLARGVIGNGAPRARRRRKSGVVAQREIRKLQKSTELIIPQIAHERLVREIAQGHHEELRFKKSALLALQEGSEAYIGGLLQDADFFKEHRGAIDLKLRDLRAAIAMHARCARSVCP